jgi:phosphatidylglycerophosphate synthase
MNFAVQKAKNTGRDRQRSNWLKQQEAAAVGWLCRHTPRFITSNMLTALAVLGSAAMFAAFLLAKQNRVWLLAGIVGLAVQWLGDSLDGRLAYFRNRPRKWYGFALDIGADWVSLCFIMAGFTLYFPVLKFVPAALLVAYAGRILIAALAYKITDEYRIDSGKIGPTEGRLLMAGALLLEVVVAGSLLWLAGAATLSLLLIDLMEFLKLLRSADERDREEKRLQSAIGLNTLIAK